MYLILDSTVHGSLRIALLNSRGAQLRSRSYKVTNYRASGWLMAVDNFCRESDILISKLLGIGVMGGPDSFTAHRQLVSMVNTIGWVYDINIVSLESSHQIKIDTWKRGFSSFIKPVYNRQPNITSPKSIFSDSDPRR